VASVIGVERMGSASWISGERIATSRATSGDVVTPLSPGRHGGLLDDFFHRLGGSSRSLRDLWCRLLHWHPRRDVTTFSLSTCQGEDKCISDHDYSSRSSTDLLLE
jgi:hypothetical protein